VEQTLALARAEELQQSRQRIVTAQESLRKEIAQQLHGAVQSKLIVLLHRCAAIKRAAPRGKLAAELEEMHQTLGGLLEQDVRLISQRLYPSILRQGLLPALQSLGDRFEAVMPVEIELAEELMEQERTNHEFIPEQVRLAAYRIAEEALTNVAKHAKASRVTMGLELSSDGWLHLRVQDNGQGFDVESTYGGQDLVMMQDYAEVTSGRCVTRSAPGEGTEVTATLPLAKPDAEHPETGSPLE
jgi:two-component system sensor histidine kinase UhpB